MIIQRCPKHNPENVTAVLREAATNNNLLTKPPRIAAQMFLEATDNQSSFTSVKTTNNISHKPKHTSVQFFDISHWRSLGLNGVLSPELIKGYSTLLNFLMVQQTVKVWNRHIEGVDKRQKCVVRMINRRNMSMTKIFKTAFQPMQMRWKPRHGQAFKRTWKMFEEKNTVKQQIAWPSQWSGFKLDLNVLNANVFAGL